MVCHSLIFIVVVWFLPSLVLLVVDINQWGDFLGGEVGELRTSRLERQNLGWWRWTIGGGVVTIVHLHLVSNLFGLLGVVVRSSLWLGVTVVGWEGRSSRSFRWFEEEREVLLWEVLLWEVPHRLVVEGFARCSGELEGEVVFGYFWELRKNWRWFYQVE